MASSPSIGGWWGLNNFMTKLPKLLVFVVIFIAAHGTKLQRQTLAYSNIAGSSATLSSPLANVEKPDERISRLKSFLQSYNSPLTDFSADFVKTADKHGLDWKLVPAITGVESTFGKQIPQGSYNAYGWANGNFYFQSWPDSIETVTKTLRENYINRGADTVEKIGPIYAPPSQTWAGKVKYFMGKIENFSPEASPLSTLSL